jgi:hypothetical protein
VTMLSANSCCRLFKITHRRTDFCVALQLHYTCSELQLARPTSHIPQRWAALLQAISVGFYLLQKDDVRMSEVSHLSSKERAQKYRLLADEARLKAALHYAGLQAIFLRYATRWEQLASDVEGGTWPHRATLAAVSVSRRVRLADRLRSRIFTLADLLTSSVAIPPQMQQAADQSFGGGQPSATHCWSEWSRRCAGRASCNWPPWPMMARSERAWNVSGFCGLIAQTRQFPKFG